MSFLTPLLLVGLPLAALPILIHLINQRRFQTVEWGAIRFLLEANRMSRGYARIRRWLILLFRTLAVAALIFAIARPLASGWLGLATGGKAETTIVIIDRSASMGQLGRGAGNSLNTGKLTTGIAKLQNTLSLVGSTHWVVIDSAGGEAVEIAGPEALTKIVPKQVTSATTDLVGLLETARDYISENRTGQTEVWILSDQRANDWNATSGRWRAIRDGFLEFKQGIRFHLLSYPDVATDNLSIEVTGVEQRETRDENRVLVSLRLSRPAGGPPMTVPIRFEIDGAGSELPVELAGDGVEISGHPLTLPVGTKQGWGRVSIPADPNPADNDAYFAFAEPIPRRIALVTADPTKLRSIEIAAAIAPNRAVKHVVDVIAPAQLAAIVWEEVALVVWHAPLPKGNDRAMIESFLDAGGQVICLPPAAPDATELGGIRWEQWVEPPEPISVTNWRGDADLLARSQAGTALPVGELSIGRFCKMAGDFTPLATLGSGDVLLARATRAKGGLYFLGTTTTDGDSTLATDGVVLYVALQRSIAEGAESLGSTRQLVAGNTNDSSASTWQPLAVADGVLSSEYPFHAGVYAAGERVLAVNHDANEPRSPVLDKQQIANLFAGLDFDQVADTAGNLDALTREIWRVFLTCMIAALVIEAGLCIPKPRVAEGRA